MASLSFQSTTFANKTDRNVYLSFPPAPPLEITPGKDIQNFSAQVEEIYLRDSTTQEQICYSLGKDISLEAGSVVSIAGDSHDLYLQYSKAEDQVAEVVQFVKASHHHPIDLDIGAQPFNVNTLVGRILETADKQDGSSLPEPAMLVGSRGGEDNHYATPSAISHHLLQTFFYEKHEVISGTRSAGDQHYIPTMSHFNTMPYNDATNQYFHQQTLEANEELQDVRSMLGLLAANGLAEVENRLGRQISPTQDSALYYQIVADAYFKAPFSPLLAGLLSIDSQGNKKIDHTCYRNEVHMYFIKQLTLGLGFDETAYARLDRLLIDTAHQLAMGKFDINDNINFVLTFTSIPKEKIPGSNYETIVPKLTVIYIQSSARIFSEIVRGAKSSSKVDMVNLKFEYNAMVCTLNRRRFKHHQNMFDQAFLTLAGQSLAAITKRLVPLTVQASYN